MMDECAAATAAARYYNVATMASQKADGRLVYLRRQDSLRATREQRNTHPSDAFGRKNLWPICRGVRRDFVWCECQQRHKPVRPKPSERTGKNCRAQRQTKERRTRQDGPEHHSQSSLTPGPSIFLLDPPPGVVHEVHIIDPRRAGRHARQARKAAVDVFDGVVGHRVITQHFFNEVNPPAGTIELVAE
jgi:hypothetical protein